MMKANGRSKNFTDISLLSTISRTRRSFLQANAPVVISLMGPIAVLSQQNGSESTSHGGSFGHLVSGQELSKASSIVLR